MQAIAQAQPNIALIKYWGKRDIVANLPAVSSLSITLDALWTRTAVEFTESANRDLLWLNGRKNERMLERASRCIDRVAGEQRQRAEIRSTSNFPVAAGLASSASAFAALALATERASGGTRDTLSLARIAGASSGSAARSFYGGFVELQAQESEVELSMVMSPQDWPLQVVVAITDESAKPLGSGDAMIRSAETSPFYKSWIGRQEADLAVARNAVRTQDFEKLGAVSEHNCLKMHSVMWTSRPPVVYWSKATLACMQTVRTLQAAGCGVFFTIDAGPQLKAVCLPEAIDQVNAALQNTPGVLRTIVSGLGPGAFARDDL